MALPTPQPYEESGDRPGGPRTLLAASAGDPYYDLAFAAYRPLRPPTGKLKAENILWRTLSEAGLLQDWRPPLRAIQRVSRDPGEPLTDARDPEAAAPARSHRREPPWRILWGSFYIPARGRRHWELRIAAPQGGLVEALRRVLAPWVDFVPGVTDTAGCRAISFRFDADTLASGLIPRIEIHRGGARPREVSVTGARITEDGAVATGTARHYLVYDTKREIDAILPRIKASRIVDFSRDPTLLGQVLLPELFACRRLHVGRVTGLDTLGFSGINAEQLRWLHERFDLSAAAALLLDSHPDGFDHLLFEAELGYRWDRRREALDYATVGYYGGL